MTLLCNKYAVNTEHDVNFYVYEYDLFELVRYIYCIIVIYVKCVITPLMPYPVYLKNLTMGII